MSSGFRKTDQVKGRLTTGREGNKDRGRENRGTRKENWIRIPSLMEERGENWIQQQEGIEIKYIYTKVACPKIEKTGADQGGYLAEEGSKKKKKEYGRQLGRQAVRS